MSNGMLVFNSTTLLPFKSSLSQLGYNLVYLKGSKPEQPNAREPNQKRGAQMEPTSQIRRVGEIS